MDKMTDSIVVTIKRMLGLDDNYTPFDMDVIVHINAALMTLCQIGVGPKEGFEVTDYDQNWDDFLVNKTKLGAVKTYVYMKVKMAFDPPTNSFVMDAMKQQCEEILFRLNVQAESVERMPFMREEGLKRGANPINVGTEPEPGATEETPSSNEGSSESGDGNNWQGAQGGFDVNIIGGGDG